MMPQTDDTKTKRKYFSSDKFPEISKMLIRNIRHLRFVTKKLFLSSPFLKYVFAVNIKFHVCTSTKSGLVPTYLVAENI